MAPREGPIHIVFNLDISFSGISNCFLFGRDAFVRNEQKTLYVDELLPMSGEINLELLKAKVSPGRKLWGNKQLIGLVLEGNHTFVENAIEILGDILASSSFHILVLPVRDSLRKSLLVIARMTTPTSRSSLSDLSEVGVCNEVIVYCLRRNIAPNFFSSSCLMTPEKKQSQDDAMLSKILRQFHWVNGLMKKPSVDTQVDNGKSNSCTKLLSLLWIPLLCLVQWIGSFQCIPSLQYLLGSGVKFFFVAKQLLFRVNQFHGLVGCVKSNSERTNKMLLVFIDVFVGLTITHFIFSNKDFLSISTWIIGQKYAVAESLQNLLKWLMGVPAGLKLNKPLNQFLGNFYIYHVYLWTSYLYFIEAYLPTIIWICTLSGCLGFTMLISVLCDVLSLLTLHIYCFYIYAARLYSLEVHVLTSLLRLFTGKKWNILRSRIDSLEYDVDRLFIGTLLFTILLFLLPTILLYYIVFTSLRLLVLLLQTVLFGLVSVFNSFPVYGLWLYFMSSDCLPGKMVVDTKILQNTTGHNFGLVNSNGIHIVHPDNVLFLSFNRQCSSLGNLFKDCIRSTINNTFFSMYGEEIFRKFVMGRLIISNSKPWLFC